MTTTTIRYTTKINSTESDVKTIDESMYKFECEKFGCYEVIPDDENVKLYFDVDFKQSDEEPIYEQIWFDKLLEISVDAITKFCIEEVGQPNPIMTICQSNSESFIDWKMKKETWKISFHIIVENVIATKKTQMIIINNLNTYCKDCTDYQDYMGEQKLFDDSIYDLKRKIRSIGCSKPKENRPLVLHNGTFEGHCISGFIPNDALVYYREPEVKPEYIAVVASGDDIDYKKFDKYIDAGLLVETCKEGTHKDYINVGYSFINVLGIEKGKTLFHKLTMNWGCENKQREFEERFDYLSRDKNRNKKVGRQTIINYAKKVDANKVKEINKLVLKCNNVNESEISENETFEYIVNEFEKTHCKIINKSMFIKQTDNGIVLIQKSKLLIAYEHIGYKEYVYEKNAKVIKTCSFIPKWLGINHTIRHYEDMDMYPNMEMCPENIFNLWVPFKCEKYTDEYVKNNDALNIILNHIKILCGNEDEPSDYFIKWIAQMIQYPEDKTICPVFISKEGAGKGTLMLLFKLMLGISKVFETTTPSRDVWGDFNSIMKDAFLVNLNELSRKETVESDGRMKGLITDNSMTINQKGIDAYTIKSYHRFIITTNHEEPISTSNDDRRYLVMRSSDELIGNKEYFAELYALLKDKNVIRTCYDYFKSIPDMDEFGLLHIPKTEYQNDLKSLNVSPIEQWLEFFTRENNDKETLTLSSGRIFELFNDWKEYNKVAYEVSNVKFNLRLTNLKIEGIEKGIPTKKGKTKIFDIAKLKKHFKIGCMIQLNNDDDYNVY